MNSIIISIIFGILLALVTAGIVAKTKPDKDHVQINLNCIRNDKAAREAGGTSAYLFCTVRE